MSGTGRRSAYRKHITEEVLNSFPEPDTDKGEQVAQVMQSRGGNILQIVVGNGEESLAILPNKFRKLIWVKRGDYLIVSSASHDFMTSAGDKGKVKYMVERILYRDQVKHLKERGLWPEAFSTSTAASEMDSLEGEASSNVDSITSTDYEAGGALEADEEESEDDMGDLPANTNRLAKMHLVQDQDDDDDEEEEEEEEGVGPGSAGTDDETAEEVADGVGPSPLGSGQTAL